MAGEERKVELKIDVDSAEVQAGLDQINRGAKDMAQNVARAGEVAAAGISAVGDGADAAARKVDESQRKISDSIKRTNDGVNAGASVAQQAMERQTSALENSSVGVSNYGAAYSQSMVTMRGWRDAVNPMATMLQQLNAQTNDTAKSQRELAEQTQFLADAQQYVASSGRAYAEQLSDRSRDTGVSDQAAVSVAKLDAEMTKGAGSLSAYGKTAAETKVALRGMLAQLPDIFASLQGGQVPIAAMLQQGGQLVDTFGSVGAAARAMGGYVLGLMNPFTAAAAAVVTMGVAVKAAEESLRTENSWQAYAEATGRASSLSVDAFKRLRTEMALMPGVSKSMAAAVIGDLAGMRDLSIDSLMGIAKTANDVAVLMQTDMPTAAKALGQAFSDPAKGVVELNAELRIFSAEQIATIQAMAEMGDKAGAQAAMLDALKASTSGLATKGLTPLQQATNDFGNAWDKAMSGLEQRNRLQTVTELMAGLVNRAADAVTWLSKLKLPDWVENSFKGGLNGMVYNAITGGSKPEFTGGATGSWGPSAGEDSGSRRPSDSAPTDRSWDSRVGVILKETEAYKASAKAIENLKDKAKDLRTLIDEGVARGDSATAVQNLRDRLAGVNEQLATMQKRAGGAAGAAAVKQDQSEYEKLISSIKLKIAQNDEELKYGHKLSEADRLRFMISEEGTKKLTAAHKAKAQTDLDELERGERLLKQKKEQEKSEEGYRKYIDSINQSADALGKQADQQEVANENFGKSKVEIAGLVAEQAKLAAVNAKDAGPWTQEHVAALQKTADEAERYAEALRKSEYLSTNRKYDDSVKAAQHEIELQEYSMSLLGVEEDTRTQLLAIKRSEIKLERELSELREKYKGRTDEASVKERTELEGKARTSAEMGLQVEIGKIQEQAARQQVKQYDDVFRKGFIDMLNNGKEGWKSFTRSLVTTFKTTVADQIYKMFAQPFVVRLVATLLGITGGAAGTAAQAGTSLISTGSTAMSGYSMMTGGGAAAGGFMNGLTAWGAEGSVTGMLANPGLYTFAELAGALAPIILGLGAVIALLGMDDSGTPHTGSIGSYNAARGYRQVQNGKELGDASIDMGMLYGGKERAKISETVAKGIVGVLDGLSTAFGRDAGYTVTTGFADDSSKDRSWGGLRIMGKDGKDLVNWDEQRTKWAPREFADGEKGYKQYLQAVATDTRKIMMESMDLPKWAKEIVGSVDESNFDINALQTVVTQIAAIQAQFVSFGQAIQGFGALSMDAQGAIMQAAGGIDALKQSMTSYYQNFYSDDERKKIQQDQINGQLDKLGLGKLDLNAGDAREKFRAMVEASLALGEEGAKTTAALLALSDAVAQVTVTAEEAAAAKKAEAEAQRNAALSAAGLSVDSMVSGFLNEVNEGRGAQAGEWLADTISAGFEKAIYGQAMSIIMNSIIDGVITPVITAAMAGSSISSVVSSAAIDTMVKNATVAADALAQLLNDPAFRKAMDEIIGSVRNLGNSIGATIPRMASTAAQSTAKAVEAAKKAQDEAFNLAMRTLEQSTSRQLKSLETQKSALAEQRSLAEESLSLITGIFDLVHESARDLYGDVAGAQEMQASQGRAFITQALSAAKLTGYLPDKDQLSEAISAARQGLDNGSYMTQFDRDFDTLKLAGELSALEELSGKQKTIQEQQLDSLDQQIAAIDKQTEFLQEQLANIKDLVSITKGEYDATMSVDQAVREVMRLMPGLRDSGGGAGGASGGGSPIGGGTGSSGPATPPREYKREVVTPTGSFWQTVTGADAEYLAKVDKWLDKWRGSGDVKGMLLEGKDRGYRMIDISSVMGWSFRDLVTAGKNLGIPQFAKGTNYVTQDTLAVVHQGERIMSKGDNRALFTVLENGQESDKTARLEALVERLIDRVEVIGGELVRQELRVAKVLEQFNTDGMPSQRKEEAIA